MATAIDTPWQGLVASAVAPGAFPLLAPNGSAAAPSYSFSADATMGLYRSGANTMVYTAAGSPRISFSSGSLSLVQDSMTLTMGATNDVVLARDAADILAMRRSTNAQQFRIYNTFTDSSNGEWFQAGWGIVTANVFSMRTLPNGTGLARTMQIHIGSLSTVAIQIGTAISGGISLDPSGGSTARTNGAVRMNGNYTGTSGEFTNFLMDNLLNDGGTNSTTTCHGWRWAPTINYTGATRTGRVVGAYFNPTNTSLPTGFNAAIMFSASASALGGAVWHNVADEVTDAEFGRIYWDSNIFKIQATRLNSGTLRELSLSGGTTISFQINGSTRWSLQASTFRWVASGNYGFSHGTSALATTATEGFLHIQSCAGAPTGVPATIPTGQVPLVIDSTTNKLHGYIGGAWRDISAA